MTLVVPAAAKTLLVDDDISANNSVLAASASANDIFFATQLGSTGLAFDTAHIPNQGDGGAALTFEQLSAYDNVVWYTGESFGQFTMLSRADLAALMRWLDLGNRRLVLASENLMYSYGYAWTTNSNPFITDYLGALGGEAIGNNAFTVTGVTGQPSAGMSLNVAFDMPLSTDIGLVNPRPGTDVLFTVLANPANTGLRQVPCATVRRAVGDAGTSTFVHVGFPILNVIDTDAGTRAGAFQAFRAAAGIP